MATAEPARLPKITTDSTVDRVVRVLREQIVKGNLRPGTPLRVASLAEQLGTSQGPVREAIRMLVAEGLVMHEHNRGTFVRTFTEDDCLDVYVAREAIETWAVRVILDRHATIDFSPLETALEKMAEPDQAIEADMRFHRELVEMAGSDRLTSAHASLIAETALLVHSRKPFPDASYHPIHEELFDALVAGSADAPSLMAHHLRAASQLVEGHEPLEYSVPRS